MGLGAMMTRQQLPMVLALFLAMMLTLCGTMRLLGQPVPADDLMFTVCGFFIAIVAAFALARPAK
jgi:hypothetical protein